MAEWKKEYEVLFRSADLIPGGRGDGRPDADFDPGQLEKGRKHEMEHTKSPELALEIAKDHLSEDPEYYDKLDKIESSWTLESAPKGVKPPVSDSCEDCGSDIAACTCKNMAKPAGIDLDVVEADISEWAAALFLAMMGAGVVGATGAGFLYLDDVRMHGTEEVQRYNQLVKEFEYQKEKYDTIVARYGKETADEWAREQAENEMRDELVEFKKLHDELVVDGNPLDQKNKEYSVPPEISGE